MIRTTPHVRFAFGRFLWRMVLLFFILGEIWLFRMAELRMPPGRRRTFMILILSPRLFVTALLLGGTLTVVVDLFVRFVVRPLILRWHAPPVDLHGAMFHFDPRENLVARSTARLRIGKTWAIGSLILTTRKLWFFPEAWDLETWSVERGQIRELRAIPAPSLVLGLIRDLPERIRVEYGQGDGEAVTLIVPDPDAVAGWLAPNGHTHPSDRAHGHAGAPGRDFTLPPSLERTA